MIEKAEEIRKFYESYLGIINPYLYQQEVWEKINEQNTPLLIKAPTGSGKTEAVLAPFLAQFIKHEFYIAPRLIYVLPMRVLVNSVAERIKKYAQKISPYISVKIQHGDLPNAPFFIADIVVTTLDQFLYGFARASEQVGKHIDVPAGAIASSLVVFDEAHMYRDEFTFSIMRALMEILYHSSIPFVVMTATMPYSLERSLFENIPIDETHKILGDLPVSSKLNLQVMDEPLVTDDEVNLSDEILKKIKEKKTLIVLNQVKRAQKVYEEIKRRLNLEYGQIVLLHSRFTRSDREHHEKKALSLIPHKENGTIVRPEGVGIIVSTQVLEAGIDFSAELLLTELAPADSLIQRAGRCARYEGQSGEMIIFPVEYDKEGYKPYEKEHLSKTLEWLQKNEDFNIRNFDKVCSFVNHTLDYQANDYEARNTLIDLYECVLYADSQPQNIQVRDSKPAKLVVLNIPEGSGEKVRKDISKVIESTDIASQTITVDTGILWSLFKDINIQWEIQWKYDEEKKKFKPDPIDILKGKKRKDEKDLRIGPFRTYILNKYNYKEEKGIEPDACAII